jgi:hypothetical protein
MAKAETLDFSKLTSVSTNLPDSILMAKADNFQFQQPGLTLYFWQRLITFGFSKLACLYTYGKGWQLSVSTDRPGSILVAKADNFRFQQAGLTLYLWQRLITSGFSKLAWLYTYCKGWRLSV